MSIREIKNYPVNSGTGMSIREAFDVVNANFNYLSIEAIPEQVADSIADLSANLSTTFTGGNISSATRILSNTDSTGITNGAFVVNGGAGIAGNVNIGETLTVSSILVTEDISAVNASITSNISTTNLAVSGSTSVNSISANNVTINSLVTEDISAANASITSNVSTTNLSLTGLGSINSLTANTVSVSGLSTFSETRNNGNLEVIGESLLRSNVFITGTAGINAAARVVASQLQASANIDSINPNTGSLRAFGGAGIVGNVNIGGNLTVNGRITVGNSYVPASSTSTGTAGHLTWDQDWFYICVGTDQWIRFAKDAGAW